MGIDKVYEVIGIEADYYRIIDDSNMPFLYDPNQFEIISSDEPDFWITEIGEDGERYSYPAAWSHAGFFEDFHDNVSSVVSQFWSEYRSLYAASKNV
ncbi:hypothetical protein KO528_01335 [Saccharophagus degradans]|uniref:hypothetical protein n=1 Tax=Saccharophagus degradans TaxID=86304 RepID=UPI001C08C857|nr:hypothetical protein [Saccharophagus degradans]MBU2983980.1 hypothetical protein [Saccharophagus degradans]